jgi:hypothetical protein
MSYQKAYVEHAIGCDYKVTWDANLLHHVVGPIANAVYKAHNDYSPLLCSFSSDPKKLQHIHKDVYLPYREQMQVLTIFCSNYDIHNECCTKIIYRYDNGSIIGTAPIPSRGIHIQGPGSQTLGIKHETTVDANARKSGIYRCICTTRLTVTPKHGKEFDDRIQLENVPTERNNECNNRKNVRDEDAHNITSVVALSSSTSGCGDNAGMSYKTRKRNITDVRFSEEISIKEIGFDLIAESKNSAKKIRDKQEDYKESPQPPSPTCINLIDIYPNIPKNIWSNYNIPAVTIRISFKDRVHQLTTGPALLCLLRRGYKIYIRRSDKQLYPCLYENNNGFLKYGHRFPIESICADAKLSHTDRTHAPLSTSDEAENIIVLTQKYKQSPAKMDTLLDALDLYTRTVEEDVNCNKMENRVHFGCYDGKITIMGSGGSHKVMGNFAPTTKSTKNEAFVEVGNGQTRSNPINTKLDKLACCNQVMAVFLNEKYYHDHSENKIHEENQKNTLRFLGYYEFIESTFVMGNSHAVIEKEFDEPTDNVWQYLTYRLHPHLRVEAKPFIDTFEEIEQLMGDNDRQYKS